MAGYSSPLLDDFNRTGVISQPLQKALDIVRTKLAPGVPPPSLPGSPTSGGGAGVLGQRRDFAQSAQPGFQYAANSEQLSQARDLSSPAPMTVLGQRVEPSQPSMRVLGMEPAPSMDSTTPAHDATMDRLLGQTPSPGARPLSNVEQAHQNELNRLTTGETGKSGIDQIHNAWLRTPLKVLGAAAEGFAPRLAAAIPGTDLHHQMLVHQAENAVANDQKTENAEAQRAHLAAETSELGQRGQEEAARAEAARNPTEKNVEHITAADGTVWALHPNGEATQIMAGGQPFKAKAEGAREKTPEQQYIDAYLADPKNKGKDVRDAWQDYQEKQEAIKTKSPKTPQLTAIERGYIRAAGGNPDDESTWSPDVMKKFRDLSTQRAPSVNVNAETSALDREVSHFSAPHQKSLEAAQGQLDKIHEAREMINGNAAAQALGIPKVLTAVVSGQGSGVRVTNAELNRVGKARGLQGDVEGTIRKWEGKGELTPEQQRQLSGVLDDVEKLVTQKMGIVNDALDKMNGARSRDEIVAADKEARKRISDLESGKQAGGTSVPNVSSKAQYDALPSGAVFMEDGKKYRKP